MKRRSFCTSALVTLSAAGLRVSRLFAAAGPAGEIQAAGTAGQQVTLAPAEIDDLRAGLKGQLLLADQEGYETARKVWNGAFDRKPALIARCAGKDDVARCVNFARTHRLLVAVRSGGHSFPGHSVCDGGLMIDLSPMKSIRVDARARTARIESGVLLGEFDHAAQAFGLATTTGTVSHTGAAGLTLGGGFGRIARKHGLACDNLIAADVVTADGRFIRAAAGENPDLFWGLRGGGGNFGVVTSFDYALHAVPTKMSGGALVFPFTQPRVLLRSFADFIASASDDLFVMVDIVPTPDGKRVMALDVCHSGAAAAAEREFAGLRSIGKSVQDTLGPATYLELQSRIDKDYPAGRGYYLKSGFVRNITPRLIDALVDYLDAVPSPNGVASFVPHGGAIGRVKPDATAYWHREASHSVLLVGFWDDDSAAEPARRWAKAGWETLEPLTEGFYVNLMSADDSARRIQGSYGANHARLTALKKKYDPSNLFKLNANIKPSGV
jgi:FAD/FMN-containing dehydrogenase